VSLQIPECSEIGREKDWNLQPQIERVPPLEREKEKERESENYEVKTQIETCKGVSEV